jgi:glycosyltransferase involved in cell wall biosynthesis
MLFSVVIPTYNRLALLQRALESVWAQSFSDLEVIVVDDGSNDGTQEWLATQDARLRAFTQPNLGPGAARNLGVQHANGEYLAFLDSDDLWFPWTARTYRQVIERCGRPAFIAGKPLCFRAEKEVATTAGAEIRTNAFPDYLASGDKWRWWGVSSFVVRRDVFNSVGGFTDEWINGEDADLAMRLGEARDFVQVCAPFTFGYREHAASAMKNFNRTLAGVRHKIQAERESKYPGGSRRAHQRRRILTRHVRPVSLECLRQGMHKEAWELYRLTFGWHAALGNWRFIAAFPFKAVMNQA